MAPNYNSTKGCFACLGSSSGAGPDKKKACVLYYLAEAEPGKLKSLDETARSFHVAETA
jgi:hypothetical protein